MGFVARLVAQNSRLYCLQYDQSTQEASYFFLLVDGPKEQAFLKAVEQGAATKIEEFGTVVASGWGEPDADVRALMAEKYDIRFND